MKILVDDRESEDTITSLSKVLEVEIAHLPVGDFQYQDCIIEHKKPDDFWESLTQPGQRLYRQLDQMKQQCKPGRYALLYSGDPSNILYSNNGIASIASCLVRGTPVIFTIDLDTTATMTKYLFEKWTDNKTRQYNPSTNPRWYKDSAMSVITGIPFVSEDIGTKLLTHFGSVKGVANASIEQLQEIKGIGEGKARKIFDALNQPRW